MVLQVLLLFRPETWVLLVPMAQRLEGVHVGFLKQVTKPKAKRLRDVLWRKAAVKDAGELQHVQCDGDGVLP